MKMFRTRGAERDRDTDEERFGLVLSALRSASDDAAGELSGLARRMDEERASASFLFGDDVAPQSLSETQRDRLLQAERSLVYAAGRVADLEAQIETFRKLEAMLEQALIDVERAHLAGEDGGDGL